SSSFEHTYFNQRLFSIYNHSYVYVWRPRMTGDWAIQLENVNKGFGEGGQVLKGLNLNIPRGAITVIIGFSGAGKSVMLKHILGLLKPDSGKIKVLGQDLSMMDEFHLNEMRKKFGMLFQSAALFDDMTTLENVCFPIAEFRRNLL